MNWKPRGSSAAGVGSPATSVNFYPTATGSNGQFVIAVSDASTGFKPSAAATLTLQLIAQPQVSNTFQQYTYRSTTTITTVSGVESGTSKKILRYGLTDIVQVFVNGVKYVNGPLPGQYQLYDGTPTSPVPPNTVLFNTPITGSSTQVDVIVTQPVAPTTQTIQLNRVISDESRVGLGAWEGVDAVVNQVTGTRYSLFYCDFVDVVLPLLNTPLRINTSVESVIADGSSLAQVDLTQSFILLSRTAQFTSIDRERAVIIYLASLVDANYLQAQLSLGTNSLLVTKTAITNIFPVLEVLSYNAKTLVLTGASNTNGAEVLNTIIVGPEP